MSETDDTDVLLLIPPNFFLVHSSGSDDSLLESSRTVVHKPQSCTAQVLGKIINQVHTLESRLESLEISSSITESSLGTFPGRSYWDSDSVESRSLDSKYFTFPRRRRRRKVLKKNRHDLLLNSFNLANAKEQVPCLKPKTIETVSIDSKTIESHDSPSMDGDLSSIVSTPSKKNDKLLLHEIDEFLTKVEAYESPDTKYKDKDSTLCSENVIERTGDYISQKLDLNKPDQILLLSGSTMPMPSNVLDKYIYLINNNSSIYEKNEQCRNNHKTSPETCRNHPKEMSQVIVPSNNGSKSPTIRKLNFPDKDVQPTSTPKKPTQSSNYRDTFKPSSNKIYDRASKVLEQYKSLNFSHNSQSITDTSYLNPKEIFKMPQIRPYGPENKEQMLLQAKMMDTINTDLLSLSELWGDKGDKGDKGDNSKLEEERLKREHCELLIQQLQKKILDQQEKLAVAIKVDRAKDMAISKLKEAWMRVTGGLDRAEERHRAALDKMMKEVDNFKVVSNEAQKKTNHYEAELYKALDLAHDYQDKCKLLSIECKQIQAKTDKIVAEKDEIITAKEKELQNLKENYETVMRLNKQSTDCAKNLEDALEKEKLEHIQTKSECQELLCKIRSMENENLPLYQERDMLKEKVNEERARGNILERQLGEKQNQVSDLLKKCDNLDSEVKALRKHLELQKTELKCHYQKQLEDAVLAKLQEFQQQLDLAEKEMENEARGKEAQIADSYSKQIHRIEEQHKLEVNVLEEKQREEIKLYRLQIAQASEKIGLLESKLESYRRRRGQLATQLHSVMETQWRQALLILTNGNPTPSMDLSTADSGCTGTELVPPGIPPLGREGGGRPPTTRRDFNFDRLSDNELQQYVKLLLTKPVADDNANKERGDGDTSANDTDMRPARDESVPDRNEKRRQVHKPPWKA